MARQPSGEETFRDEYLYIDEMDAIVGRSGLIRDYVALGDGTLKLPRFLKLYLDRTTTLTVPGGKQGPRRDGWSWNRPRFCEVRNLVHVYK
jgi:hypothetical protein